MVEKIPRDFEEIVKKFHNNFGDLFFFVCQGEIENQISQHPLKVPQNPSSNTYVRQDSFTRIFSKFFSTFPEIFSNFLTVYLVMSIFNRFFDNQLNQLSEDRFFFQFSEIRF